MVYNRYWICSLCYVVGSCCLFFLYNWFALDFKSQMNMSICIAVVWGQAIILSRLGTTLVRSNQSPCVSSVQHIPNATVFIKYGSVDTFPHRKSFCLLRHVRGKVQFLSGAPDPIAKAVWYQFPLPGSSSNTFFPLCFTLVTLLSIHLHPMSHECTMAFPCLCSCYF